MIYYHYYNYYRQILADLRILSILDDFAKFEAFAAWSPEDSALALHIKSINDIITSTHEGIGNLSSVTSVTLSHLFPFPIPKLGPFCPTYPS